MPKRKAEKTSAPAPSTVLILPDNFYLKKALPPQILAVTLSLLIKSKEYEISPSFLHNVNSEVINVFHGLPAAEVQRLAVILDRDANTVVRSVNGANELCRCLAICELIVYLNSIGKVSKHMVCFAAAEGILIEANTLGEDQWGGAKGVASALGSAKLAIAKIGYMYQ